MSYGGRSESDICQQKLSQIIEGVNVNIHFLRDWKTSTVRVFFLLDVSRAANLQDDIIIWGVCSEELEHVQLKSSKQLKSRD